MAELIKDGELRREMGTFARDWMEKYYNDREMVSHYVRAYEDLLERPEAFKKPRFDTGSRLQVFLANSVMIWFGKREKQESVQETVSPA